MKKKNKSKKKKYKKNKDNRFICHNCGREFNPFFSDAERNDIFCCVACEFGY